MALTYEQIVAKVQDKLEFVQVTCADCLHQRSSHMKFVYPDRMATDYKQCQRCKCKEFRAETVNALDLVEWIERECVREGVNIADC